MSVTFSPVVDYQTLEEDKLNWTADFVQHCKLEELPDNWKKFADKPFVGGDIGYFLWNEGNKPLSSWQKWLKKFDMILSEDKPFKKVYIDNIAYKVAIILNGEPPEHHGIEMQLSNRNAYILCQYLGIPEYGHMHPRGLMNKIDYVIQNPDKASEFAIPSSDTKHHDPDAPLGLGDGPRIIDQVKY